MKNITIIKDVIKKAKLPSSVLLKIFVFPYFLPIMAAAESEKLIISKAGIHILLSKKLKQLKNQSLHSLPQLIYVIQNL